MANIYESTKTGTRVISGKVAKMAEDRMSCIVATQKYDRANHVNTDVEIEIKAQIPFDESIMVGKSATVVGYVVPNMTDPTQMSVVAMHISAEASCYDYGTLSVVTGDVVFASFKDERDENGQPKMTKEFTNEKGEIIAPHEKKPHFDIGVNVKELDDNGGTRTVLHTAALYPHKGDMKAIERLQKAFANFDKTENPARVTLITQPGREGSYTKTVGDKEYINYVCNHMGINNCDIEYVKAKENTNAPAQPTQAAPAQSAPVQESAPASTPAPEKEEDDGLVLFD